MWTHFLGLLKFRDKDPRQASKRSNIGLIVRVERLMCLFKQKRQQEATQRHMRSGRRTARQQNKATLSTGFLHFDGQPRQRVSPLHVKTEDGESLSIPCQQSADTVQIQPRPAGPSLFDVQVWKMLKICLNKLHWNDEWTQPTRVSTKFVDWTLRLKTRPQWKTTEQSLSILHPEYRPSRHCMNLVQLTRFRQRNSGQLSSSFSFYRCWLITWMICLSED